MAHQPLFSAGTLLRLLFAATCIGVIPVAFSAGPATALTAPRDPIPPRTDNWGYHYGAEQRGHNGTGSRGNDRGGHRRNAPPANSGGGQDTGPGSIPICGTWRTGIQPCEPINLGDPGAGDQKPTVPPVQLAQRNWDRLPIPEPEVRTAPARGTDGLVGLPHWFWVTNWDTRTDRTQAGDVWAEITARPTTLTISPGSGLPQVQCAGPGSAYDQTRPAAAQHTECSYTFIRSSAGLPRSAYRATVTVTWGGSWHGSDGTGGTLPPLSRSASFPIRVSEGQAVTGG